MFRYMLNGGEMGDYLLALLMALPVIFISLSVHETAHGYVALKLGDPTARNFGRLTLNPMKHLDVFGFLCILLTGFGWAKPVPVNSRHFKKPRRDMALVALAGPLSNLLLAVCFLLLLRFVGFGWLAQLDIKTEAQYRLVLLAIQLFYNGIYMNLTLAVFNLLPVTPLDGSRIILPLLPPRATYWMARNERTISLVILVLFLLGPLSNMIGFITELIMKGLFALVGMAGFL